MKYLMLFSILFIIVLGCAVLNQSTIEVPATKLSSSTNPKMVDGNLNTVSTFITTGHVEKKYQNVLIPPGPFIQSERRYTTNVIGRRTVAEIKLDEPTYITYVEVYPASRIPNLALITTSEDPPKFDTNFDVVRDKYHINIEGTKPVKFQINREILYLRLTADGIEDKFNSTRERDRDKSIHIPLKGASIKEVKFYAR
ncbi:hypothetical protein C6497_11175 [Candidatus Poribacteria bacterium]|nr:MAG: hypothetical protein C6497_11175 [Candidatus Poribacteria bacterium]